MRKGYPSARKPDPLTGAALFQYLDELASDYEAMPQEEAIVLDRDRFVPVKETARLIRMAQSGQFKEKEEVGCKHLSHIPATQTLLLSWMTSVYSNSL